MRIVDLTKPIKNYPKDPGFMKVKIKHESHKKAKLFLRYLGLPFKLFPKNWDGWANDVIQKMGVHATTHIDAPWHYAPTCEGKPSKTIDQIPLEWCYGEGVVIDMKHKKDFDPISTEEIKEFLERENIKLTPGQIVLIKTGRDALIGTEKYAHLGTGMSAEATEWLIDQGIKVMGIDQWGWDLPLPYMIKKAKETKDPNYFWEAHLVGRDKEYCHIEQLVNLDALPYTGFKVCVFPMKIMGASAAPARVVALFDE